MASAKFAFCFVGREGNIVCQHHNGSWIVFPSRNTEKDKASKSSKEDDEAKS